MPTAVAHRFPLALLVLGLLALGACSRPAPAPPPPPEPPAVRATDLPAVGHFRGVLPCAGCEGVRTDLLLSGNWEGVQRYHLVETYVGGAQQSERTVEREGVWTTLRGTPTNDAAKIYQLDPDRPGQCRHFMVVDDRTIRLLDDALEPVGAPLMRVDGR